MVERQRVHERPDPQALGALASNAAAIVAQAPDTPGYPAADTLFPFGFGLTY